jgi:hypothetical protein
VLAGVTPLPGLTRFYLVHQDVYVLVALLALLVASALGDTPGGRISFPQIRLTWRTVVLGAAILAMLLWAGAYLLLDNYPLTRDEHMAAFDMAIFRGGHLAAPLDPAWRRFATALTPAFLLPLQGNAAWVSGYMPGNAMLRAAFSCIADPTLMNPVLAAVGGIAVFGIGKRIFPESRGTQTLVLLLYATSAQLLAAAMTSYAMTAHLALNLVWLLLYLRGTRPGHAAAIALGFVGIGLHQIVFHPLFAAPFIDQLRRRGDWRTAAAYAVSYAAFLLFWISYPHLVAVSAGTGPAAGAGSGSTGFIADRILPLLENRDPTTVQLTAANVVRFVAWQNLALLPLMLLSAGAVRRDEGIARPLAWGVLLTIVAMTLLLPYQGHGWGYRYLHGLIGSCALLAGYGWREFREREQVRRFVRIATVATLFGSLPFLLWQAHTFVHPYARLSKLIDRSGADIVVVDTEGTGFVVDEVRNSPDLSNRPIRLASTPLHPTDIQLLCARGTLAFVGLKPIEAVGLAPPETSEPLHFRQLRDAGRHYCRGASLADSP